MTIEDKLRTKLRTIHPTLSPAEACAIIDVARLAAAADKRSDVDEIGVLLSLRQVVTEMAGGEELELVPYVDIDRLLQIGDQLVPMGARELAFAGAFLVMIQDLELTEEESQLASNLGDALVIDPMRAKQLAAEMEALVRDTLISP